MLATPAGDEVPVAADPPVDAVGHLARKRYPVDPTHPLAGWDDVAESLHGRSALRRAAVRLDHLDRPVVCLVPNPRKPLPDTGALRRYEVQHALAIQPPQDVNRATTE